MPASMETQLAEMQRQLSFVMQTLSLTKQGPNGQTESRSLQVLYQEMMTHVGTTPQTFADVAQRAFAASGPDGPDPDLAGPDGFSGTDNHDSQRGHPV